MDELARFICVSGNTSPRNVYMMFRKTFTLAGKVRSARLSIFADSKYEFFVNGRFIGRGPARFDPRFPEYDLFEETGAFREGENCIAVLVHHYGEDTFDSIPCPACLIGHAEIDLENGERITILTDETWKVKLCSEWDSNSPKMNLQLGFAEIYDARKATPAWNTTDFDSSNWEYAVTVDKSAWGSLSLRSIPQLMEEERPVRKLLRMGTVVYSPKVYRLKIRFNYCDWQSGPAFAYTYIHSPTEQIAWIGADRDNLLDIWINGQNIVEFQTSQNVPDQRRAALPLRLGWNMLFAHIERTHDFFGSTLAFPSDAGLIISATCSKDDADSFFVTGPFSEADEKDKIGTLPCPPATPWNLSGFSSQWTYFGGNVTTKDIARLMTWEMLDQDDHSNSLSNMYNENIFPLEINPDARNRDTYLLFDFGEEVSGYPLIELDAEPGVMVDLCYAEELRSEHINPYKANISYADRYVTVAGCQVWETFSPRAFRYLQIVVRDFNNHVTLKKVGINFSTYPVEHKGSFECSDVLLNRIWKICSHTLQLCMQDAYVDTPWRERGQWWGDAKVQFMTNIAAFGDVKLMARGLRQIAQSKREDGRVNAVYPGRFNCYISDYDLIWIHSLWDYYCYSGDTGTIRELFSVVQAGLGFFERHMNADGLTELDPKEIMLIDWVETARGGAMTAMNTFLYKALRDAANMAVLCGEDSTGRRYDDEASRISEALNLLLWDERRGCYADAWRSGILSEEAHLQGNALLLAYGLVREDRKQRVIRFLERELASIFKEMEKSVVVKSHLQEQVVTPYFMYYVFEGLYMAGCDEFALSQMRQKWGWMLERDATTCLESFSIEDSHSHAWSSSPAYFLSSKVLGVEFPVPGDLSTVHVSPRTGDVSWARGTFPHPQGCVRVEWQKEKTGAFYLKLSLPQRMRLLINLHRTGKEQVLFIDGKVVWEAGKALPVMKDIGLTVFDDLISVEIQNTENAEFYLVINLI